MISKITAIIILVYHDWFILSRSQLATIVLAGINDVTGVCVGGILGHFICTGLAGR